MQDRCESGKYKSAVLMALCADLSLKHPSEAAQVWRGPRLLPPVTMVTTNELMISLVKYNCYGRQKCNVTSDFPNSGVQGQTQYEV